MSMELETWLQANKILTIGYAALGIILAVPLSQLQVRRNYAIDHGLIFVALGIWLAFAFTKPVWYDEMFTWNIIQLRGNDFLAATRSDVHPPLYYLIVRLFALFFGDSPIAMRLPSLIAAVGVMWLSQKILHRSNRNSLILILVALHPQIVQYAAEARYPMILAFLVVAAVYAGLNSKRWLWTISLISMPWIHATGAVYAVAVLIWGWMIGNKKAIVPIVSIGMYGLGWALPQISQMEDFWLWQNLPIEPFTDGLREFGFVAVALTVAGLIASRRDKRDQRRELWLVAIVGIGVPVALWLIGELFQPVLLTRATIGSLLIIMLFTWERISRPIVVIVASVVLAWGVAWLPSDWDTTTDDVFSQCSGTAVATTATNMAIMANYFSDNAYAYIQGNNKHQRLSDEALVAMFNLSPPELTESEICYVFQRSVSNSTAEMIRHQNLIRFYDLELVYEVNKAFLKYEVWRRG